MNLADIITALKSTNPKWGDVVSGFEHISGFAAMKFLGEFQPTSAGADLYCDPTPTGTRRNYLVTGALKGHAGASTNNDLIIRFDGPSGGIFSMFFTRRQSSAQTPTSSGSISNQSNARINDSLQGSPTTTRFSNFWLLWMNEAGRATVTGEIFQQPSNTSQVICKFRGTPTTTVSDPFRLDFIPVGTDGLDADSKARVYEFN